MSHVSSSVQPEAFDFFFPSELVLLAWLELPEVEEPGDGVRVFIGESHCGGLSLGG